MNILVRLAALGLVITLVSPLGAPADRSGDILVEVDDGVDLEGKTPPLAIAAQEFGHLFDGPGNDIPLDLSVPDRVDFILNDLEVNGDTPQGWLDRVDDLYTQSATATADTGDLVDAVLRLAAMKGAEPTVAERAALQSAAVAVPAPVLGEFAHLVTVVADAYEAQAALGDDLAERIPSWEPGPEPLVSEAEREAMALRGDEILAALNALEPKLDLLEPTATMSAGGNDPPLFADPWNLVILGGLGDATYPAGMSLLAGDDPVLIVEPGGNDRYEGAAGGADYLNANLLVHDTDLTGNQNGNAVGVVADFDGSDEYVYEGRPSAVQGAATMGGIGILVDTLGDDIYYAEYTRTSYNPPRNALGQYYWDGGAQGYGFGGYGLLLDVAGTDSYTFETYSPNGLPQYNFGQGFGAQGGLGIAHDVSGNDAWHVQAIGENTPSGYFVGIFSQGGALWGGVGIISDTGAGSDTYSAFNYGRTVDYYAQGFGAFGGLGIQYDDAGNDDYEVIDHGYDSWISPVLNCAYGTASAGGVGILVDGLGDDRYYGTTITDRRAYTMNEGFGGVIGAPLGLHADFGGDDERIIEANGAQGNQLAGRGDALRALQYNTDAFGTYLDVGGQDTYVGPPYNIFLGSDPNDQAWVAGADIGSLV